MVNHYVRGELVYPSVTDAPDWRWVRVDGQWTEINRPDPLYCTVYFPPRPRHDAADYPASLAREVAKANRLSDVAVVTPIVRGHADPKHLFDVMEQVHHGGLSLAIYRASDGYTRTAHLPDGGFVKGVNENAS